MSKKNSDLDFADGATNMVFGLLFLLGKGVFSLASYALKSRNSELEKLSTPHQTTDQNYVMPGMGQTIGQMGGTRGKHYPRQGKIHCMVFEGMSDDDLHYSWDVDPKTGSVIGEVYMHPNNPSGKR